MKAAEMSRFFDARRGQSSLEYALFVAAVATAVMAMSMYLRRAVQANLKVMESASSAGPMQQ